MPAKNTDTATAKKTRTRASFVHQPGFAISVTQYTVTDADGMVVGIIKSGAGLGYNPCDADGNSFCYGAFLPSKQNAYDVVIQASQK